MRAVATALLLAAALLSLFALPRLSFSPLLTAPAAVAIGVAASVVAAGGWTWLAVVFGAVAPLLLTWLMPWSPTAAISCLCLLWMAPRAWVARRHRDLVVFAVTSVAASIVAGSVSAHFLGAPLAQHVAACIFAGAALAVTTVVVRAEPPVAHALDVAARALEEGPVRDSLVRAADLRRTLQQRAQKERGDWRLWRRLAMRADARVGLTDAAGPEAEQQRRELDREILILVDRLSAPQAPSPVLPPEDKGEKPGGTASGAGGEPELGELTSAGSPHQAGGSTA